MKPKILCVDDEQLVLDSLAMTLGREFDVLTATSGAIGLELLQADPEIGVVLSDMRMPVMNGAEFLRRAELISSDCCRLLLTGDTDLDSAALAVNEGHIFRFLKKPCPPIQLLGAVRAAGEQNRLVRAEKELLEQTLLGSITMITEIMGLVSPSLFGRVNRIKQLVSLMAEKLDLENRWQVEVAASLSQLGLVSYSHEDVEKICHGREAAIVDRRQLELLPTIAVKYIAHIPRLEGVCEILQRCHLGAITDKTDGKYSDHISVQILKIACLFERYSSTGVDGKASIRLLLADGDTYDQSVIEALKVICAETDELGSEHLMPVSSLNIGMILLEDIRLPNGTLFAPKGFRVTASLVHRIRNFGARAFERPVRVQVISIFADAA